MNTLLYNVDIIIWERVLPSYLILFFRYREPIKSFREKVKTISVASSLTTFYSRKGRWIRQLQFTSYLPSFC